jgi:hypothetical protein
MPSCSDVSDTRSFGLLASVCLDSIGEIIMSGVASRTCANPWPTSIEPVHPYIFPGAMSMREYATDGQSSTFSCWYNYGHVSSILRKDENAEGVWPAPFRNALGYILRRGREDEDAEEKPGPPCDHSRPAATSGSTQGILLGSSVKGYRDSQESNRTASRRSLDRGAQAFLRITPSGWSDLRPRLRGSQRTRSRNRYPFFRSSRSRYCRMASTTR